MEETGYDLLVIIYLTFSALKVIKGKTVGYSDPCDKYIDAIYITCDLTIKCFCAKWFNIRWN